MRRSSYALALAAVIGCKAAPTVNQPPAATPTIVTKELFRSLEHEKAALARYIDPKLGVIDRHMGGMSNRDEHWCDDAAPYVYELIGSMIASGSGCK